MVTDATKRHFGVGVFHLEYLGQREELAKRLKKHGLKETEASVTNKLARGTFPATFFLACIAAMELEGVALEEI